MTDRIYCPECGEQTPRSGAVCGHCGARLARDADTPPQIRTRAQTLLQRRQLGPGGALRAARFAVRLWPYDSRAAARLFGNAVAFLILWVAAAVALVHVAVTF